MVHNDLVLKNVLLWGIPWLTGPFWILNIGVWQYAYLLLFLRYIYIRRQFILCVCVAQQPLSGNIIYYYMEIVLVQLVKKSYGSLSGRRMKPKWPLKYNSLLSAVQTGFIRLANVIRVWAHLASPNMELPGHRVAHGTLLHVVD